MDPDQLKLIILIIQAGTGLLVPVLVVIFGLKINRQLEQSKVALAREKEWRTKWAEMFYIAATDFVRSVGESVCLLFELAELGRKDDAVSAARKPQVIASLNGEFSKLQRLEWNIQTQIQFSPHSGAEVIGASAMVLAEVRRMVGTGQGSFEVVRTHLREFNNACKTAYREMLEG